MNPTKTQRQVLQMMRRGWELKDSSGPHSTAWLSKIVKGRMETRNVRLSTIDELYRQGLICGELKFPIRRCKLTKKGRMT